MTTFLPAMVFGEGQLDYVLPGVRTAYEATRADAAAEGIVIAVANFGGARTSAIVEQLLAWRDEAVANGEPSYRVAPYGKTYHGYGGAVDFHVESHPATMSESQAYARVGALARPHGLVWGGTFSAPADIYHLQSQQTLAQLAPRWDAWVASPEYPRMGAAEWSVLAVVALLAILFVLFYHR